MSDQDELIEDIYNKYKKILKNQNISNYENRIRIDSINKTLKNLNIQLDELSIELNRNRKFLSEKTKLMLIENKKVDKIINHYLPSITKYNSMQNDDLDRKYRNNFIDNTISKNDNFIERYKSYNVSKYFKD